MAHLSLGARCAGALLLLARAQAATGNAGVKRSGGTAIGHSPAFTALLSTRAGASQVGWHVGHDKVLDELARNATWTPVQTRYVERVKRLLIGDADAHPKTNVALPTAICQWDCWQRATMLEPLLHDVLRRGTPGDIVEAGVLKGGISIAMTSVLCASGALGARSVYVVDSFAGMPPAAYAARDGFSSEGFTEGTLVGSLSEVQGNFRVLHAARDSVGDERTDDGKDGVQRKCTHGQAHSAPPPAVHFVKGWFNESLPGPIWSIALLRADSDLYSSIMDTLERLYPLISPGGWVVFDDWKFQQAQEAILAYREKHGITSTMHASGKHKGPPFTTVDQMVFWRKD